MPRPLSFQSTPWQVFEITSRCIQSRFLLTPGDESNRRLLGVLGRAQELYGEHVRLHMVAGTSNHLHLLVSSRDSAWRARFKAHLKTNISKELGDLHGWSEHLFGRRARDIPVLDEEALLERVRYLLAHGVKEGLVARPEDWPGPPWVRALTEGERLVGVWYRRTDYYNRARAWARRKKPDGTPAPKLADFADEKEVRLAPLPTWLELTEAERRSRFQRIVDQIHPPATSGDAGRGQADANVLGATAILRQDPHHRPAWTKRTIAPRVHATSDAARFEWLEAYRCFVEGWRSGLARLRSGDFLQVLPAGGVLAPPVMALVEEQPRGATTRCQPPRQRREGGRGPCAGGGPVTTVRLDWTLAAERSNCEFMET